MASAAAPSVYKRITVEEAKQALGKGKGTGKKGWFGSKGRKLVFRENEGQGKAPR